MGRWEGGFRTAMLMVEGVLVGEVGGCETLAETWQGLKLGVDGWGCLCLAFVSVGGGDEVGWEICGCDGDGNGFGGLLGGNMGSTPGLKKNGRAEVMAREEIVTFFLSLCNVVRLWDLISKQTNYCN